MFTKIKLMFSNFFNLIQAMYINRKTRLTAFVQSPTFVFTLPLVFLLSLVIIRIFSIAFFDKPEFRSLVWVLGFFLILYIWSLKDQILAKWLNHYLVQSFMFICLRLEDIIYSYKGLKGFFVLFVVIFGLVFAPAILLSSIFELNYLLWWLIFMLFFSIYFKLRGLFIFPDATRIEVLNNPNYMPFISHPDKFNWNLVVENANCVIYKMHGRPVSNQLSLKVGNHPLRYAGIRYMSSTKAGLEALKHLGGAFTDYAAEQPKKALAALGIITVSAIGAAGLQANANLKEADANLKEADRKLKLVNMQFLETAEKLRKERCSTAKQVYFDLQEMGKIKKDPEALKVTQYQLEVIERSLAQLAVASPQELMSPEFGQTEEFLQFGYYTPSRIDKIVSSNQLPCVYEEPTIFFAPFRQLWVLINTLIF